MTTKAFDFTVRKENLKEDTLELYGRLFENVNKEDVHFEELKGGNINIICLVTNKNNENKSIIFRNFNLKQKREQLEQAFKETSNAGKSDGNRNEDESIFKLLFDREGEINLMNELSKHNLCQKVLAKWNNGIAYKYTHGVVCDGRIMLTDDFLEEMSLKLARLHTLKIDQPDIGFKTHLERSETHTGPMMDEVGKSVQDAIDKVDVWPYKNFPKLSYLQEVQRGIQKKLDELGLKESDVRFCHNDLNSNNIIFNKHAEKLNQLGLIDLEMAMPNYSALELGYMFMCFTGYFLYGFEPELYPDQAYRLKFIRSYLQERNRLEGKSVNDKEFEKEVEWLYHASTLGTLHNFLLIVYSLPCLDFRKDLFRNPDLDHLVKDRPYYFGEIALKMYEFFLVVEKESMKQAEEYLKRRTLP